MKMVKSISNIHQDFDVFSRALIESKDVDPVYPFLKSIVEHYGFNPEWFVMVYVAFYSLESAIFICGEMPTHEDFTQPKFRKLRKEVTKFGHERRGTARNVDVQCNMFDEIQTMLEYISHDKSYAEKMFENNGSFRSAIETLPQHSGWASFKIAELFEKSLGYESLAIPDLGLQGRDPNSTDGPIGGLRWLYGRGHTYDKGYFEHWNRFGVNLAEGWGVDIGEVETSLCKFHKLMTGKYYVGHDIHEFQELVEVIGESTYKELMTDIFDPEFVEIDGKFVALDKNAKKTYERTGEMVGAKFAKVLPELDIVDVILNTD